MSLGWILALCVCVLLAWAVIVVARSAAQSKRSRPFWPRDRQSASFTGRHDFGDFEAPAVNRRHRMEGSVYTQRLNDARVQPLEPLPAEIKAPEVQMGVRRVYVDGQLAYDGEPISKLTIRISGAGDGRTKSPARPKRKRSTEGENMSDSGHLSFNGVSAAVPTHGLIILSDPLNKILSGTKTLELRKKNNKRRGRIALIQKGSGTIVGVATIGDCIGPMTYPEFSLRMNEHGVEAHRLQSVFDEGYTVGWELRDARRLTTPVAYVHKPGAVTWVLLGEADRAALGRAMGLV